MNEERKRCGNCKRELPRSSFNRAGARLQHWCRDCFRDYFRRRGVKHVEQAAASRRRRAAAAREAMDAYLLVLEFDHVGSKRGQISHMVFNVSLATLKREIAECEIRCCNCHRRATAERRVLAHKARTTVSVEPP